MKIYVKVNTENCGPSWYVHERDSDGCGSYLSAGDKLEAAGTLGYEYLRGSAAKSWTEAKQWAKNARMLANFDGMGKTHITFWTFRRGGYVRIQAPKKK